MQLVRWALHCTAELAMVPLVTKTLSTAVEEKEAQAY